MSLLVDGWISMNKYGDVAARETSASRSKTMNKAKLSVALMILITLLGCQNQQATPELRASSVETTAEEVLRPLPQKEASALILKAKQVSKDWLNNHFEKTYNQLSSISVEKAMGSRLDDKKRYRMTEAYRTGHPLVCDLQPTDTFRNWTVKPIPISIARSSLVMSLGNQNIVDKLSEEMNRNDKKVGTWEAQFWKRFALLEFDVKGRLFYQMWFREDDGRWSIMHWPLDLYADLYRDYEKFAEEFKPPSSR